MRTKPLIRRKSICVTVGAVPLSASLNRVWVQRRYTDQELDRSNWLWGNPPKHPHPVRKIFHVYCIHNNTNYRINVV